MRRFPFMQDLEAQRLMVDKYNGCIGIDARGHGYFQFRSKAEYEAFLTEWQQMKKSTVAGRS
ncbi:MAG: hypothetical protein ABF969_04060 [Sporolactobacillus sp.]